MSLLTAPIGFKLILGALLLLPVMLCNRWLSRKSNEQYTFSYLIGTALALIMLRFTHSLTSVEGNAFFLAAGIVTIVALWKFLFGPWRAHIKAAVLGTFVFWIYIDIVQRQEGGAQLLSTLIATVIAAIPAVIWCVLFLRAHRERLSVVLLTFFAGMLSTAPILFYDHVVRSGYKLHFFLFQITPENFMRSSREFVAQSLTGSSGIISESIAVTIVSFLLVGVIEEWSKHWVTRKSDRNVFTSINDVIQLSIIAAIGFAFAENIVNPTYFIAFVQDYLVEAVQPDWALFLGSVFGRAIITNMVHITCSGILGYYYGLAFFARPVLEDDRAQGRRHRVTAALHKFLRIRRVTIFKHEMMVMGLFLAMTIHGLFDVAVSLPDVLPGHPQTVGDLFGIHGGPLAAIQLILIPAVTYVLGGWVLLIHLFRRRRDIVEYGHKYEQEVYVTAPTG